MNLKNYIKKKLEKDNTQYLLKIYHNKVLIDTIKVNITALNKYLTAKEREIEKIKIILISN